MERTDTYETELSPGQARFALEHEAKSGVCCCETTEVFLYREEPWATYRWLVDRSGQVLDSEIFRRSPQESFDLHAASRQSPTLERCGR